MRDFFSQAGWSGIAIAILALFAIFMAVRGVTLLTLTIKNRGPFIATLVTKTAVSDQGYRLALINSCLFQELKGVYNALYYLKLCAAVGPLLGLLGTVLGMVEVFSSLSEAAVPDPQQLAGGIWQALLTTVMGLTLAIPALIVHYYLLVKLRQLRNAVLLEGAKHV